MSSSTAEVELVHLQVSPYSLRARWMLSYHDIPHITSTYTPVLGEPWLRFKAGKMLSCQRVTAPLLVTQRDGTLCESLDIAQWADDHSNRQDGLKLLPAHQLQDIKRWNEVADSIMAYLRSTIYEAAKDDEAFKLKMAPKFLLGVPGGRTMTIALSGFIIGRLADKYQDVSSAASLELAQEALRTFRAALKKAGGQYLLGSFSYADILLAILLQALCPPRQPRTLPAARMTVPLESQELYDEFRDLQPWADSIFDKHFAAAL